MYSDSNWTFVVWLILSLLVSWLLIYTAVRAGVGHALDRVQPRLIAEAHTTLNGVEFVVCNVGTGPAFDVSVWWSDRPTGEALARTPMLGQNGKLEWTLAAEPIPDETQSVRRLKLDWGIGSNQPDERRHSTLAVLVPARLDAAR